MLSKRMITIVLVALLVGVVAYATDFNNGMVMLYSDGSTTGEVVVCSWAVTSSGAVSTRAYPSGVTIRARANATIRIATPDWYDPVPFTLSAGESYTHVGPIDTVIVASQTDTCDIRRWLK